MLAPSNATGFHGRFLSQPRSLSTRHTCGSLLGLLHPDVLPKSRRPKPRPTTCTQLTTHDPTEPLYSGSRLCRQTSPPGGSPDRLQDSSHSLHLVGLASSTTSMICPRHPPPLSRAHGIHPPLLHRLHGYLQSLGDTIRSPTHLLRRRRPLGKRNCPPGTDGHLEIAPAVLLTMWLILFSTSVGAPTALFYGYLGPNHAAFTRPPTVPPRQLSSLSSSVRRPTTTLSSSPNTMNSRFFASDPALYLRPHRQGQNHQRPFSRY